MGNEILKNHIYIISIFTIINSSQADTKQQIKVFDELFDSINKKRYGLEDRAIAKLKNPFILKKRLDKQDDGKIKNVKNEGSYKLNAILSNRALINNTWVKLHQFIKEYKLVKIKSNSVILDNGSYIKKLYLEGGKSAKISIK